MKYACAYEVADAMMYAAAYEGIYYTSFPKETSLRSNFILRSNTSFSVYENLLIGLNQLHPPCLPPRGHPRVASLAPSGQFTFRGTALAVEGVS